MTDAPAPPPIQQTIRHQALARLSLVMIVLTIGISLLGFNAFYTRQDREVDQQLDITRDFYAELLPKIEANCFLHASQLRARIEYTRILEEGGQLRWAKLNTFLTAQWEFIDFSNLLLLAPDGQLLYRYGSEISRLPTSAEAAAAGWHFDSGMKALYRIIQIPLWMGDEGQGTLVVFKSLNPGVLQSLITPETHLHFYGYGTHIASSHPLLKTEATPGKTGLRPDLEPRAIQVNLPWPHENPQAPILVVHRNFTESISFNEFMLRPSPPSCWSAS